MVFLKPGAGLPDFIEVGLNLLVGRLKAHGELFFHLGKRIVGKCQRVQVHVTCESQVKMPLAIPFAGNLHFLKTGCRK